MAEWKTVSRREPRGAKKIRNEFSWSKSRDEVFRACPRQYHFSYYAYWGGWREDAPPRTRQIYILKNLKNRYMWAGEKVHECLKHTLRNLQRGVSILEVDDIVSITLDRMREEFRSSREKRYLLHPRTCALFEHEYGEELDDAEWKRVADNVEQCLRNFYGSEMFLMLKDLPRRMWLEIEDFSSFYLDGTKIWAVIDCSFRTEEGAVIIDWKTGRSLGADISLQLACYAMYAMERWRLPPERVRLVEYNLLSNRSVDFTIGRREIESATSYIRGSIADMQSLLADVANNVPREERFFRKTGDEKTRARCNFRKVCD
ncbi:MAG: PD-(D/E)XK nuclease family protein [Deltaproteobacteria bacterium]|nr:PD-(D/E)XK nuclease family protein [Deltaproteobacteria bacterium]MBW2123000.1 PD-(D/E)XK nuclease family protein [Deltaproteobacteria bacterium]